jgi:hypothetical protein
MPVPVFIFCAWGAGGWFVYATILGLASSTKWVAEFGLLWVGGMIFLGFLALMTKPNG